jgi:zinc transporter ZupT
MPNQVLQHLIDEYTNTIFSNSNRMNVMDFNWLYFVWALALGAISAVSLPMGSVTGLVLRPKATVTATAAAFGAGALIAALTIELVAPTIDALHGNPKDNSENHAILNFIFLIFGCV